jgi:hypothetical protein
MRGFVLSLIFVFSFFGSLYAQDEFVEDASVWLGLNIEKKVNSRINLSFSNQARFDRNITRYRLGYQDLGLDYKVLKFLHVQADYKLIQRQRQDESFSIRHQYNLSFFLKKNFGPWSFSFKNRWQYFYRDIYSSEDGKQPVWTNRNKLTVKYELNKRIQFYTSGELNYILKPIQDEGLDRYRTTLGLEYRLTRNTGLELYYTMQRELNLSKEINRFHIYGLTYQIKI